MARRSWRWLLAAAALGSARAGACAGGAMELRRVENATATCADGSPAGYFVEKAQGEPKGVVVWLGDSDLCSDDCDAYCDAPRDGLCPEGRPEVVPEVINGSDVDCFYNELHCSSALWGRLDVKPDTLLCGDADALLPGFTRVFVPQCTLDWFLGDGSQVGGRTFGGAATLAAIFDDLVEKAGLADVPLVVLGGTRGGGVGAMHHVAALRAALEDARPDPAREVLLVLDSAWFVNVREFGVVDYSQAGATFQFDEELRTASKAWIEGAALDPACRALWADSGNLHRCLYASNALTAGPLTRQKTFIVQSQFDLLQLLDLGVVDDKEDQFVDEASYSQAVLSYVQGFGTTQRESHERASEQAIVPAAGSNHYYFVPACAQHGLVVPTTLHRVSITTKQVADAGSISFTRAGTEWEDILVRGMSLRGALEGWITSGGEPPRGAEADEALVLNQVRTDRCGDFLCNPTCPTTVQPFVLSAQTELCEQSMVVVYVFVVLGLMWLLFAMTVVRICMFDAKCRKFWREMKSGGAAEMATRAAEQELLKEAASESRGRSIQLMVENLNYWAPSRSRKGKPIHILRNVSLNFKAGSVHAMMGPSGSGKSTLLDVLSYTRESGRVTGTHYINGVPSHLSRAAFLRTWLRNSVSYVRQQDVLFPKLTVRQHLQHAAWLTLPQFMPARKKLYRVHQVIRLLELESCADTVIGDGGVRMEGGISGGQRRRVSVATQLLSMPAAIVLDEPTSGLDSTNALLLVQCLKNLATKSHVTVIMTLHQPRREIFQLLDYLSILVRGRVVFSGRPGAAAEFFGVELNDVNVGDAILDVLQEASEAKIDKYRESYQTSELGNAVVRSMEEEKVYLTPQMATALRSVLVENALAAGRWSWTEATSTITTMWVLTSRTIKRGGFDLWMTSLFSAVGGLLVGAVFRKEPTYTSQTALAYLAVATVTFLQSTFLGTRYNVEKQMWSHERDNGTKVSWVAFLLCLFMRNIVTSTVEGLVFAVPVFFLGNMFFTPEIFLNYVLLITLVAVTVVVQNTTIEIDRVRRGGSSGPDARQAVLINMSLLALSALFNGFIIQLDDMPAALSWVPYIMLSYWGFVGVLVNNFSGNSFPCSGSALECAQRTGDNWVRSFSYDNRDTYQCMFALLCMIAVLHIVSILDFYLRFAFSTSTLRRGRPRGAGRGEDDGLKHSGSTTPLQRSGSSVSEGSSMNRLMRSPGSQRSVGSGADDGSPEEASGTGTRGRVLTALLSRENLVLFFILDLLTAWNVCFFNPEGSIRGDLGDISDSGQQAVEDVLGSGTINFDGVPAGFVVINLAILAVYVVQFVLQILFLVPLRADGHRSKLIWVSKHDLVSLVLLAADAALLLGLFLVAGDDLTLQVVFIAAVHAVRYLFVSAFWLKVNAFHRSRARQYLAIARGEVLGDGEAASFAADDETGSLDNVESGSVVPPGASPRILRHRSNRLSGLFNRAPPPPPPSRSGQESQRFRQLDLGPQWAAFQREQSIDYQYSYDGSDY